MKAASMTIQSRIMTAHADGDVKTDGELVLLTLDGRQDAYGEIVDRYRGRAIRVAAAIVGDMELARDLTQDAFIKAYRSLSFFDHHSPFLPWFYRILRNTCLDQLRRKNRLRGVMDKLRITATDRGDLRTEANRFDTIRMVRRAVAMLKDSDREILELRHFSGMSYDEIASTLNIPRGTVMSRLHYARRALHDILVNTFQMTAGDI
ncbi:RNA polymerase sigma factor [bacterium]|nr:RNA polymerase sigma factor [candidate division CSSED10-310 bacterium]